MRSVKKLGIDSDAVSIKVGYKFRCGPAGVRGFSGCRFSSANQSYAINSLATPVDRHKFLHGFGLGIFRAGGDPGFFGISSRHSLSRAVGPRVMRPRAGFAGIQHRRTP